MKILVLRSAHYVLPLLNIFVLGVVAQGDVCI